MRYSTKAALLDDIRLQHDALVVLLDGIPTSRCRDPGVWGDDWSVHDLIAHLAEWHAMFFRWYDDGLAGRTPAMPAPGYKWNETPRLNHDIWERHRDRRPATVRAEFERGYRRVLALVEKLSEQDLLRPGRFPWTGKSSLATYLAPNSAGHYRFAVKAIGRWWKRVGGSPTA